MAGSASFEWAADGHCYVGQQVWHVGSEGGLVQLEVIGGWDAATNETVEQGFSSAGDSATVRYSTRRTERNGGRADGQGRGQYRAGPVVEWDNRA